MKYENNINVVWTDGNNPSNSGYFDGAADLNDILLKLFAGKECSSENIEKLADVMGSVEYGTKCKIKFSIEIIEKEIKNENVLDPNPALVDFDNNKHEKGEL